ncbi:MAG: phosphatidate cytidylyltransferase [Dehalococcoidia bacterium]
MLRQRLLVAAAGIPLLALLLAAPEPAFALVVQLLLAYAAYEMMRAAEPNAPLSYGLSAAAVAALFLAIARTSPQVPLALLMGVTVATIAMLLIPATRLAGTVGGWWMGATLYAAVPGAHFILARNLVDGRSWLVVLLAITFATDTGAYAVGRLLGRHRLAPAISPNKTVEGALGGLIAGAAAAIGIPLLLGVQVRPPGPVLLAAVVPLAAMAGDLVESALKRRLGVKDMSNLLPGHGGLLDRLDSLLLAGPCLYWIVRWFQVLS